MAGPVRPRCSRCGEREDLLVRIGSLATLIRDASSADGLGIDITEKTSADYDWIAFHCGRCGHEAPRRTSRRDRRRTGPAGMGGPTQCARRCRTSSRRSRPPAAASALQGETVAPAGDPDWLDLADVYLRACRRRASAPGSGRTMRSDRRRRGTRRRELESDRARADAGGAAGSV